MQKQIFRNSSKDGKGWTFITFNFYVDVPLKPFLCTHWRSQDIVKRSLDVRILKDFIFSELLVKRDLDIRQSRKYGDADQHIIILYKLRLKIS